jgi:hypothetical protein
LDLFKDFGMPLSVSVDSGGQKVENKYILLGPQVIRQVLTTFPKEDVVIKIDKK